MQITCGLSNSTRLMKSCSSTPSTMAGRKATRIESAKRRDSGLDGRVTRTFHSRLKYSATTARMAPSWIRTMKVSQL
jgi:hypothetical protein